MAQKRITDLPEVTSLAVTDIVLVFQSGQSKQCAVSYFTAGLTFDASAIVSGILPVVRGGTGVAASTGTGSTVLSTSPALVTPNLGTPTALVGTNITGTAAGLSIGGNAATVTTNANLTGGVTSVGNAATVITNANLTGHVTSTGNAAVLGSFTVAQLNTALSDGDVATGGGTATGTNTGDQTNISGNAATVTTNANLTGDVTSVGNATTLTNAPVIAKVLTGFASGAGTVTAADSILTAFQKVVGNASVPVTVPAAAYTMNYSLYGGL
jgi:hypothetical protein